MKKFLSVISGLSILMCCAYWSSTAHAEDTPKIEAPTPSFDYYVAPDFDPNKGPQYDRRPKVPLPTPAPPKCPTLIVKIADVTLSVPREGTIFRVTDGSIRNNMQMLCETKFLDNVSAITTYSYTLAARHKTYQTEFQKNKRKIDAYQLENNSKKGDDGIERLGDMGEFIYLVPEAIIPSYDGNPVAFSCHKFQVSSRHGYGRKKI